ncbi:hypothetical protein LX36DRAFT_348215 [Colletotrichum falcatum]|nr:hypothetical protein LX36DRAFT_348215 [Colletotrichum falcatum]
MWIGYRLPRPHTVLCPGAPSLESFDVLDDGQARRRLSAPPPAAPTSMWSTMRLQSLSQSSVGVLAVLRHDRVLQSRYLSRDARPCRVGTGVTGGCQSLFVGVWSWAPEAIRRLSFPFTRRPIGSWRQDYKRRGGEVQRGEGKDACNGFWRRHQGHQCAMFPLMLNRCVCTRDNTASFDCRVCAIATIPAVAGGGGLFTLADAGEPSQASVRECGMRASNWKHADVSRSSNGRVCWEMRVYCQESRFRAVNRKCSPPPCTKFAMLGGGMRVIHPVSHEPRALGQ